MLTNPLDNHQIKLAMADCQHQASLVFGGLKVLVHTNEKSLLDELKDYYKSYLIAGETTKTINVYAIHQQAVEDSLDWLDVPREAGKQGKKEGYLDSTAGRWIKKFKTGMLMLQRQRDPVVVGPCLDNLAQIINFVNNQFINTYLRQDCLLGHASGYCIDGDVTAIAAGSGGGKSTLMLRCLEDSRRQFLTNDRLLMQVADLQVNAIGVAKLPRVNPGTLLHSHQERLKHILPDDQQVAVQALTQRELWVLEQKYDVQIEDEYGPDRVTLTGKLKNLIMLDWTLNDAQPTQLNLVDLNQEPDAIEGLRKRPGPFYQDDEGDFKALTECDSVEKYCAALQSVKVYRLSGRIDFDRAFELIAELDKS